MTAPSEELRQVSAVAVDAGSAAAMISSYRVSHGLGRVRVEPRLMSAAAHYARAMGSQGKVNHRIGGSLARRVTAVGYDWGVVAENLGAGYPTLGSAIDAWRRSPGHRQNLVNPNVTEIGIAAVKASSGREQRTYWALILASPPPERSAAGPFALELFR
jgi:uncharacterized protein YkwD